MKKTVRTALIFGALCFTLNAQWVQTSGLSQHTVLSLAALDSILFAGTYNGVYLSSDNGDHWSATGSLPFPSTRVLSLSVMPGLVFAGTDAGVCRSGDKGASWQAADSGMPKGILIHSIKVGAVTVYAGTDSHGIFSSVDYGATWSAMDYGLPTATSVYSLTASDGNVLAGTRGAGIFYLSGPGWTVSNAGLPATATAGYVLSLASYGGYNFVAGIGSGVYVSDDGGLHWTSTTPSTMQSDVNGLTLNKSSGNVR